MKGILKGEAHLSGCKRETSVTSQFQKVKFIFHIQVVGEFELNSQVRLRGENNITIRDTLNHLS